MQFNMQKLKSNLLEISARGRDKQCEHKKFTLRGSFLKDSALPSYPRIHIVQLLPTPVLHIPGKEENI